jgi:hypothetical protein
MAAGFDGIPLTTTCTVLAPSSVTAAESNKTYTFSYEVPNSWFPAVGIARVGHVAAWQNKAAIFIMTKLAINDEKLRAGYLTVVSF